MMLTISMCALFCFLYMLRCEIKLLYLRHYSLEQFTFLGTVLVTVHCDGL